jgi:(S)-ureidoglycine aminohydrolase
MIQKLGLTRTVVRPNYALLAPDGFVPSGLPGWSGCTAHVLISAVMGARFSQYLIALDGSGHGMGDTAGDEWFFYVVSGSISVNGIALAQGGYAFVPPSSTYEVRSAASDSTLLVFRKAHEPLSVIKSLAFFSGHEADVAESPFLGDPHARLKVLIPDTPSTDMAVNIFTYDPGATLPFVETHVMEHGMLFLAGGGIYRLDTDWHPVTAGDAIWIASYCAQWFIAAGPGPARYIYYKDVNRLPA